MGNPRTQINCGQLSLELQRIFLSAQAMIATQSTVKYSPPELPDPHWYFSPMLELPAGTLHQFGCGRVLASDHFVLGVGLSPNHYVVVEPVSGFNNLPKVMDQAVGFLAAHGACILRVKLRCPMIWFADAHVEFRWDRCLIYFVRNFLSTDPTDPPWIPPQIWPVVPVGDRASAGCSHWSQVEQILAGVEADGRELLPRVECSLSSMARRWEFYMARLIVLSERAGTYHDADRESVARCDHLAYSVMTRFAPGYELLPITTVRLL